MSETEQQIFETYAKDYLPVFNRYKIVLDHGDGVYVWDIAGRKYLDFLGGIAVNVLGHNYPSLVAASTTRSRRRTQRKNLQHLAGSAKYSSATREQRQMRGR